MPVEQKVVDKADVLIEALPYIRRFNHKVVVVKYGGSAMADDESMRQVMRDIVMLKLVGFKPVIVHGGGKEINRWLKRLEIEPKFIDGTRVTDAATMEIAEMVLYKVSRELVAMVESFGLQAVSLSGKDGNFMHVHPNRTGGNDFGYVGEIDQVNPEVVEKFLDNDFIPVICPIGIGDDFHSYNINADVAACAVAKALHAEKLAFLSDIEGVYLDGSNPDTLVAELHASEAEKLIEDGIITGGMVPKMYGCIDAVRHGVNRVHILDGRIRHSLLLEIFTDQGVGTAILNDGGKKFNPRSRKLS